METVSCSFPSGSSYTFSLPFGINDVTVRATGGGGGNSTTYPYVAPVNTTNATLGTNQTLSGNSTTPTNTTQLPLNGTISANATAVNATKLYGGVGAIISANFTLVSGRLYTVNVGSLANGSVAGYNGGGYGFFDNSTNSTTGGGGGRSELIDSVNGTTVFCAAGGGGAGSLFVGGNAMGNGNGTMAGRGMVGGSSSADGQSATVIGAGAGGGGCPTGGSAANNTGDSGAGGLSFPAALASPQAFLFVGNTTNNSTQPLKPGGGSVSISFRCPVSSY